MLCSLPLGVVLHEWAVEYCPLRQQLLTGAGEGRGYLAMARDFFFGYHSMAGVGCHWHLVGGGQDAV